MQYKGHELKPLTERKVWEEPHTMLCWDEDTEEPEIRKVLAFFPELQDRCHVVCIDGGWFAKCAEIPEMPKSRRATNRELAKWLSQGNGQKSGDKGVACISYSYGHLADDCEIDKNVVIRKWEDTEWHEPTIDYMGIEEVKYV